MAKEELAQIEQM